MNYAQIETSKRLKRVLEALSDGQWHSTFELNMNARVTSAGTAIAELGRNGYTIEHRNLSDGRAFEYRLISKTRISQSEMFGVGIWGQSTNK